MRRDIFTLNVAKLIMWIDSQGWSAYLSYAQRTDAGQKWLYEEKLSRCDGVKQVSAHQYGDREGSFAVDIYISGPDNDIHEREKYIKAHRFWEILGGDPVISWDLGHFQVS